MRKNLQYVTNLTSNDAGLVVEGVALSAATQSNVKLSHPHIAVLRALADRFYGVAGHGYTLAGADDLAAVTLLSRRSVTRVLADLKALDFIVADGTFRPQGIHASQRRGRAPTVWRFTPDFIIAGLPALEDAEVRRGVTTKATLDRIRAVVVVDSEGERVTTMRALLPEPSDAIEPAETAPVSDGEVTTPPDWVMTDVEPLEGEFPPDDVMDNPMGDGAQGSITEEVIPGWLSDAMTRAGHANSLARWTGENYQKMVAPLLNLEVPADYYEVAVSALSGAVKYQDEREQSIDIDAFASWARDIVDTAVSQAIEASKHPFFNDTRDTLRALSSDAVADAFEQADTTGVLAAVDALVDTYPNLAPSFLLDTVFRAAKEHIRLPLAEDTVVRWTGMALKPSHAGMSVNAVIQSDKKASASSGSTVWTQDDYPPVEDEWTRRWNEAMGDEELESDDDDDERNSR